MVSEEGNKAVQLSVCVIGRNEGAHLAACAASLLQLGAVQIGYETIFVDSASHDDSVAIARAHFDKVVCLAPSASLNAGAARNVGTAQARGDWILYMDGDMELSPEILPAIKELIRSGALERGLCAYTENVYPDGTRDLIQFRGNVAGTACRMVGGTSILPRLKVLEAGNWACTLFAYEEAELYARLLAHGVQVIWHECKLVDHKTPRIALLRKLKGAVLPYGSYLGKKFYGAGQVTRLTLRNGNFMNFARLKPEAYLMLGSVLLAAVTLPILGWHALVLPALALVINSFRLGVRGAINYVCWQTQVFWGIGKLRHDFRPVIEQVYARAEPAHLGLTR